MKIDFKETNNKEVRGNGSKYPPPPKKAKKKNRSAITTRTRVISKRTSVIFTRTRVISTRKVQFQPEECDFTRRVCISNTRV
jgi:hypothetical protein